MESLDQGLGSNSPDKDSGDDQLMDERIMAPGLTIVEEEGSLSAADLAANAVPNEIMYRVMQVGSSGEVIELPQIVTGNFNGGSSQPATLISNPLNTGQFYIVGSATEMMGGGSQRTIAPRGGNLPASRDPLATRASGGQVEPRDDRRRVSHNEVERRRRDKINNWILKLGKIMPSDSTQNDTGKTSQQSKGGILAKACDYITDMRTANQRLAEALRQSEHHVEQLEAENAALRKELEQLHLNPSKS